MNLQNISDLVVYNKLAPDFCGLLVHPVVLSPCHHVVWLPVPDEVSPSWDTARIVYSLSAFGVIRLSTICICFVDPV